MHKCPMCGSAVAQKLTGRGNTRPIMDRDKEIIAMYQEGKTLQQIGYAFGFSRERARQLIKKYSGMVGKDGGQFLTSTINKIENAKTAAEKREARCMKKYGCDRVTFSRLSLGYKASQLDSPMNRFYHHRKNAARRGIQWDITFAEWMTLWLESGKWYQRGRGIGKYVMARKSDTGPYSVGNVYITTADDNVRDYQARLKIDGVVAEDGYARLPEHPIFEEPTCN